MKKILLAIATGVCALSATVATTSAVAQPRPGYERPHHRPHKVWVPAHRMPNGRFVRGHYAYR